MDKKIKFVMGSIWLIVMAVCFAIGLEGLVHLIFLLGALIGVLANQYPSLRN